MGRQHVNTLTVNTDASWHPRRKVGGYAYWVVCDLFRHKAAGPFKTEPRSSTEAEIMAIGNALFHLNSREDLPTVNWLIINTDCVPAMRAINEGRGELGSRVKAMLSAISEMTGASSTELRHVKAHVRTGDARSWVNDWCDKSAKEHMRKQLGPRSNNIKKKKRR